MTPAAGGTRLSPTGVRRLRLGAYLFCGVLTLWLVISVIVSVVAGLQHGRARDPFTGAPVHANSPTPVDTSPP